jgi:hypothetical protein
MSPSTIEVALKTIDEVAHHGSWKARIASLEFLQVRLETINSMISINFGILFD